MLVDLTSKELIQLNVQADDWMDAVRKAAKPLVDAGKITEAYIQATIVW